MANTYLQRTPSSAGNRKTFTFSAWIKRAVLENGRITSCHSADNDSGLFELQIGSDQIKISSWTTNWRKTNRKFRDVSAWYHVVMTVDTTQSTANDRIKLYVNGVQETSFEILNNPSQNYDTGYNQASITRIGTKANGLNNFFNGSMSHIHFIDGTAYDASAFGETDTTTGEWKAKTSPSVTYGTNGFFILKDGNGITDQSGEGNDFTLGGGTLTDLKDNPDNTFATLNSLDNYYCAGTFSNGNNTIVTGSSQYSYVRGTLGATQGKWYYEAKAVASSSANTWYSIGWSGNNPNGTTTPLGNQSDSVAYQGQNGTIRINTVETSTGTTFTTGDIIGTALDLDNNKVYFYKNGTLVNSGGTTITASTSTTNGVWLPAVGDFDGSGTKTWSTNFGNGYFGTTAVSSAGTNASDNGIFEYDVPTGYTALSTKGLNL